MKSYVQPPTLRVGGPIVEVLEDRKPLIINDFNLVFKSISSKLEDVQACDILEVIFTARIVCGL